MKPLSDRQARFVEAYVSHPLPGGGCPSGFANATRAARSAGYAHPGKQGPRLLTFPAVARRVERLLAERYPA